MTTESSSSPWDRLQVLLVSLKPDQTITIDAVVSETGLSPETANTVLDCLTKAGLFHRRPDDVFVRKSLFRTLIALAAVAG